jgi:hypothetical protein
MQTVASRNDDTVVTSSDGGTKRAQNARSGRFWRAPIGSYASLPRARRTSASCEARQFAPVASSASVMAVL